MPLIDIQGLDKATLLSSLYNVSTVQGLGALHASKDALTVEQAQQLIDTSGYEFDYLFGRVLKIDLSGDLLDSTWYDRDVGEGAASRVVEDVRARALGQTTPDQVVDSIAKVVQSVLGNMPRATGMVLEFHDSQATNSLRTVVKGFDFMYQAEQFVIDTFASTPAVTRAVLFNADGTNVRQWRRLLVGQGFEEVLLSLGLTLDPRSLVSK